MTGATGPLAGIKVVELGGVGAVPFCCMLLADLGADVVRIDRPAGYDGGAPVDARFNLLNRGRRSVLLDLKDPADIATARELIRRADVVVEGFRPGVAERLGLGPEECAALNPAIVFGRLTGWGQQGPRATEPGHDVNYIALSGVLHAVGNAGGPPVIPLNLGGDFGGGALYLAIGVLSAVLEARASGIGQVVDAAMVDGSASLMTLFHGLAAAGYWSDERGTNRLDGGAPWYNVYETSDGHWISVGSNEARFWLDLLDLLGLDPADVPDQHDRARWPELRSRLTSVFRTRTRAEWVEVARGRQTCLVPVLSMEEATRDPHLVARGTFAEIDGITQPAPAPRFSRTPGSIQRPPPTEPGQHTREVLRDWGVLTPANAHTNGK